MREIPPPVEVLQAFPGIEFRQTARDEWHATTCPRCGASGKPDGDRLMIRTDGTDPRTGKPRMRAWCRQCKYFAWVDQPSQQISAEEIALYRAIRAREEQIRAEERARKIAEFSSDELFREYHRRMTETQRTYWREAGIPDDWADWWQLGWTPARTFSHNGEPFVSEAYTIPIFAPAQMSADSTTWAAVNCQYRISNPPEGAGKYRQEPGLPAAAFVARPDWVDVLGDGRVCVVEGAKKAAVLCVNQIGGQEVQHIGIPGARSWAGVPELVRGAERVYIMLDPDAQEAARDLAHEIGKPARVVTLPAKPDDMITQYGATAQDFAAYMRQAV